VQITRGVAGQVPYAEVGSGDPIVAQHRVPARTHRPRNAEPGRRTPADLARCAQPIRAKTLIVAGGRDRFYGTEMFAATAALIPDSSLHVFPRRGHITVAGDARAQAMIAAFLDRP
jgi:pimeloyl-ACP methyl ester carboxylesterase